MAYDLTQLIVQPTRETNETSIMWDIILMSHPDLHKQKGVLKYNFSEHYLVHTDVDLNHNNVKRTNHNSMKFKDMKIFNHNYFIDDLKDCDMFNDSVCEKDISLDKWKLKLPKWATRVPLSEWKWGLTLG